MGWFSWAVTFGLIYYKWVTRPTSVLLTIPAGSQVYYTNGTNETIVAEIMAQIPIGAIIIGPDGNTFQVKDPS